MSSIGVLRKYLKYYLRLKVFRKMFQYLALFVVELCLIRCDNIGIEPFDLYYCVHEDIT